MEESTNPPVPSNCTSLVCPDPAHDDLALHAEWSDEDSDSVGDGPLRDGLEDRDVQGGQDDPDDHEDAEEKEREDREVQDALLSFSGANAPEILRVTMYECDGRLHVGYTSLLHILKRRQSVCGFPIS